MKPCPFCGCEAIDFLDIHTISVLEEFWYIECPNCQSQGGPGKDLEEAIKLWNRRAV